MRCIPVELAKDLDRVSEAKVVSPTNQISVEIFNNGFDRKQKQPAFSVGPDSVPGRPDSTHRRPPGRLAEIALASSGSSEEHAREIRESALVCGYNHPTSSQRGGGDDQIMSAAGTP